MIHPLEKSTAAVASTRNDEGDSQGLIAHALTEVTDGGGDEEEASLKGVEEWVRYTGAAVHGMTS